MARFLTDGQTWLGPYSEEEPFAIARGTRTLREVHQAAEVYAVTADTEEQARKIFRSEQQR
jgi:hypothetical protein